ncbi:MAG: hypothetical protein JXQ93_12755 [Flavobacteriaceae bacterium]
MKKFLDKIFKPYIFPIILLIAGAFLKTGENLKGVTSFFSDSTNKFIRFFSTELYLWEIILYLIVFFILVGLYKLTFKQKTSKERKMLRAIKRTPKEFPVQVNGSDRKFIFKFEPTIGSKGYYIKNLWPYCLNCTPKPLRMTEFGYGDFRCNCGEEIDFRLSEDVKSRIITVLEENE